MPVSLRYVSEYQDGKQKYFVCRRKSLTFIIHLCRTISKLNIGPLQERIPTSSSFGVSVLLQMQLSASAKQRRGRSLSHTSWRQSFLVYSSWPGAGGLGFTRHMSKPQSGCVNSRSVSFAHMAALRQFSPINATTSSDTDISAKLRYLSISYRVRLEAP